ncbi:hypothetical protein FM106_14625 [Brachybacterium faecium]|nr:hypothetical protein FM106_14625 [Brachybacterium faecium]
MVLDKYNKLIRNSLYKISKFSKKCFLYEKMTANQCRIISPTTIISLNRV